MGARGSLRCFLPRALLCGASFVPAWCVAQPATGKPAVEELEEIVVTATRRQLALSDVPLSMSVLSERAIYETGARGFRDYVTLIPGATFSDVGYADAKITVRGISTDIFSEVRDLTAVYLDEVPITNPGTHLIAQSAPNPYLVDIRQVELLRGPQGTLFGANSMGGTLRIVTQRPDPAAFSAFAEASIADIEHGGETYAVNGMVNVPLPRESALRLVGYYEDFGGYIDNAGTGRRDVNAAETTGARLAATIPFGERLSLALSVMHQEHLTDGMNQANIALPDYTQTTHINEYWEDDWTIYNALLTYQLDGAELLSSTSYQDRSWAQIGDASGSGFLALFGFENGTVTAIHEQDLEEFTQEFRLTSRTDGDWSWLLGLYFMDRDLTWRQSFPAPGFDDATGGDAAAAGNPDNLSSGTTSFDHQHAAVYGELLYEFSRDWSLTVGGRWFRFEEDSERDVKGILSGGTVFIQSEATEESFVPKVTLAWAVSPETLVYATASQGFRPGGPNFLEVPLPLCEDALASVGLDAVPEGYESDSLWNYEIGARSTLLRGKLQGSVAAFRMDWTDVQILAFLSCGTAFISNAAEARSEGVEAELTLQATDSLSFSLSGAYIDARITEDVPVLSVESGEALPGVPELSLQANATWRFWMTDSISAYLRADYRYVDETAGTFVPEGFPRLVAPSYETLDLAFGLERGRWAASLYFRNVFDEYGIVNRVDDFGLHPGDDYQNLIQPRTLGLTVRARFD